MKNYRIEEITHRIHQAKFRPLDVLLVGATGVGKSTTLNALFGEMVAQQGDGVDPETQEVHYYPLNDVLRFWDSPGLGDGMAEDKRHSQKLIDILYKTYKHSDGSFGWIDLVLVILDGSHRDLGTTYQLLEDIILQNISADRVIVAINQADMAMKGRYWDYESNQPENQLLSFLEEKSSSVAKRLHDSAGLHIKKPVFYSAQHRYHLTELLDLIIAHVPNSRRDIM